jgi:hypothetical protein
LSINGEPDTVLLRNTITEVDRESLRNFISGLLMIFLRPNGLSSIVLLVYLSSIISGGLHHHDSGHAPTSDQSTSKATFQITPRLTSDHEESDDCTICMALHQAKALPGLLSLTVAIVPVGQTALISAETPEASVRFFQQARAPPLS